MITSYTKPLILLLAFFGLTGRISASNAPFTAEGCVITQNDNTHRMKLQNGRITQSFRPCTAGALDYVIVNAFSTTDERFAVEMRINEGGTLLTRQQLILPSANDDEPYRTRIAAHPYLEPSKLYTIELIAPQNKSIGVEYTYADRYAEGSLSVNGAISSGDLAFEVGIRAHTFNHTADEPECDPQQNQEAGALPLNRIKGQTFTICQTSELLGLSVGYRAVEAVSGVIHVSAIGDTDSKQALTMTFEADRTNGGHVLAIPQARALLSEGEYVFRVECDVPAHLQLLTAGEDRYREGALLGIEGAEADDLVFQVIIEAASEHLDSRYQMLAASEQHECLTSQPFFNGELKFEHGTVGIDLPLCDDGDLECIYIGAKLNVADATLPFRIVDDRNRTVSAGIITSDDFSEHTLTLCFDRLPVLYHYTYRLEIEAGQQGGLTMAVSDNFDHSGISLTHDKVSVRSFPAVAIGMKPYSFSTPQADENPVELTVYPNPFSTQVNFSLTNLSGRQVNLTLYSFLGHEVATFIVKGESDHERINFIPEVHLDRGFYTLRMAYDSHVYVETLVKQ